MAAQQPEKNASWASTVQASTTSNTSNTFASKVKEFKVSDISLRGIRFTTDNVTTHSDLIKSISNKLNNPNAVQHLQQMPSKLGTQNWNAVLSNSKMVEDLMDADLPLLSDQLKKITITPMHEEAKIIPFQALT